MTPSLRAQFLLAGLYMSIGDNRRALHTAYTSLKLFGYDEPFFRDVSTCRFDGVTPRPST